MNTAITSPVFELVKTIEVDFTLRDEMWPTRFEILRDMERQDFTLCGAATPTGLARSTPLASGGLLASERSLSSGVQGLRGSSVGSRWLDFLEVVGGLLACQFL
jgi:hypothetical protein